MKTYLLRRGRELFPGTTATGGMALARRNRRAWIRAIRALGSKWLMLQPVQRQTTRWTELRRD
jgi:hypothetical protein